jgi:hypothetical protein
MGKPDFLNLLIFLYIPIGINNNPKIRIEGTIIKVNRPVYAPPLSKKIDTMIRKEIIVKLVMAIMAPMIDIGLSRDFGNFMVSILI